MTRERSSPIARRVMSSKRILGAAFLAAVLLAVPAAHAATSASVFEASLKVEGSAGNDDITLTLPPPGPGPYVYAVVDPAGVIAGNGCTVDADDDTRLTCSVPGGPIVVGQTASGVGVYGHGGDDTLRAEPNPASPAGSGCGAPVLYGGDGHDRLLGSDCSEVLDGGAGGDVLVGAGGDDHLDPGGVPGPDGLLLADGSDSVDGGANGPYTGIATGDWITYTQRADDLTLDLGATAGWGAVGENDQVTGVENVLAGLGDDHILGGPGPNLIKGDPDLQQYGEPGIPIGPTPPASAYGANTIDVRGGDEDYVDCGPGVSDWVWASERDRWVACEGAGDPRPECANVAPSASCGPRCHLLLPQHRIPDRCYDPPCPELTSRSEPGGPCVPPSVRVVPPPRERWPRDAGVVRIGRDGWIRLPLRAPCWHEREACQIEVAVIARLRSAKHRKPSVVTLGEADYEALAATKPRVRARIYPSAIRQVRKRRAVKATVRVTTQQPGWVAPLTRSVTVTLKPPRRRKP